MNRATSLFLKALGAIYLIAFVSFGVQAGGLIGSHGILPAANYLRAMREAMGASAFWYAPTVFWASSGDLALRAAWIAGAALSIVLIIGFYRRVCLIALLVLYLSISTAGQDFWSFQWDILLTEAGFLAIFADGSRARTWLFRWLLFRLMFMSGAVKLLSGDPTWRNLTALHYHYETQPLPTPIAWYMEQLPLWFQKLSTVFVFLVELFVPFLIFAPFRIRRVAGAVLIALQILILLTGNYTFFNLLAIALCVFVVVDDRTPARAPETGRRPSITRAVTLSLLVFVLTTSGLQLLEMVRVPLPAPARGYLAWISPLRLVNSYGLFAVMTTTRPEIIMEGSNDGVTWTPYEFRYKPGDVKRAPPWVAPYQPRLDWQMWFAALGSADENRWFYNFAARLLQGSAPVLGLLQRNPFPGNPPHYIRAVVYDYTFTDFAERRQTGAWWRREEKGLYLPPISLRQ
ncbi:MAG TPA: lipase maturation factor family protein [Bryobacteraceae bacterium]|nr:lipase maturation factor family protein [Bryobacteraceae bacterium]